MKQHLAAIRMLFDYLVTGGILPMNPASSVRGPKYSIKRGKTPVLSAEEARQLLDSIETDTIIGLRDRALIGVMVYSFSRVSAAVSMRVEDYFQAGKRWKFRFMEKGGKYNEVFAHHNAEAYVDAYLDAAGIWEEKKVSPLPHDRSKAPALSACNASDRCAAHGEASRARGWALGFNLQSHVSRNGNHHVSSERRQGGSGPADRRPRIGPDHWTLRSTR